MHRTSTKCNCISMFIGVQLSAKWLYRSYQSICSCTNLHYLAYTYTESHLNLPKINCPATKAAHQPGPKLLQTDISSVMFQAWILLFNHGSLFYFCPDFILSDEAFTHQQCEWVGSAIWTKDLKLLLMIESLCAWGCLIWVTQIGKISISIAKSVCWVKMVK